MLKFSIKIQNPFFYNNRDTQHYYELDVKLTRNKNFEIQISRFNPANLVELSVDLEWNGRDHAGPGITFEIFGFFFNAHVYDSRHWNYDEHRWMTDDDMAEDAKEWAEYQTKQD